MIVCGFLYFGLSFLLFSFASWHYFLSDRKNSLQKVCIALLGGFLSSNIMPIATSMGVSTFYKVYAPHISKFVVYLSMILIIGVVYLFLINLYASILRIRHRVLVFILYSILTLISNITNTMLPHMDEPKYILLSILLNLSCVIIWYVCMHKDFEELIRNMEKMEKANTRILSLMIYLLIMLTYTYGFGITMYRAVHQLSTWDDMQLGVMLHSIFALGSAFAFVRVMLRQVNGVIENKRLYKDTIASNQRALVAQAQTLNLQENMIEAFADILENKSQESGGHVKRVAIYSEILAREIGLSAEEANTIRIASMMHDVGKILIPNEILEKKGRLTEEEFDIMKRHVLYGDHVLKTSKVKILITARNIAREHHERWDGTGYMHGLKGDEISIEAQIVAVADVFDALTSQRSYKHAWDVKEAFTEIVKGRGTQFSPRVVDAFMRSAASFRRISRSISEEEKKELSKTLTEKRLEAIQEFLSEKKNIEGMDLIDEDSLQEDVLR
jgi:HD-GYP domain-containing protein (c-di-GMP phosphodiesterase class II)